MTPCSQSQEIVTKSSPEIHNILLLLCNDTAGVHPCISMETFLQLLMSVPESKNSDKASLLERYLMNR